MASALTVLFLGCWLSGWSGVLGHFWPSSSISVSPRGVIAPGEAVTIRCQCWCWTLFLYKDGHQIRKLAVDGDEGEFTIPSARREDGGVYSCRSHSAGMLFSWWEASDSVKITVAETYYPKPSISLSPSGRVGLGAAVTVRCQAPQGNMRFLLHRVGKPTALQSVEPAGDLAEFPIRSVGREDAGNYSCYYRTRWDPPVWSEPSDPVELVVAGPPAPRPSISLSPSGVIAPGGAVIIRCRCRCRGWRLLLYKDGIQVRELDAEGGRGEFPIPSARREDGGVYSCRTRSRSEPPDWSEPSGSVWITVAETYYPKPSISLSPSGRVGLGAAVTVRCQAPQRNMRFLLHKAGKPTALQSVEPAGDLAEFPIRNVSRRNAGNYSCYYLTISDPPVWSEPSDPVELTVSALSYPKPNISLRPSGRIVPGGAVTVRCACRYPGMRFLLYKPGDGAARRWAEPAEDLAEFPIRNASRRDAGRYSCQYCTRSDPPVWSEPSDPMELVVAEGNDPAGPQQPDPPPTEMEGAGGTDRTQPGAVPAPTRPGSTGPAATPERPDFTYANITRLGLGAGVLLILGMILAEACYNCPRGGALGAWIRLGGEENMPGGRAAAPWGAETPAQTPGAPASENPPPPQPLPI